MAFVFQPDWYPDVRAVIGLDVTPSMLPDEVLASAIFTTEAQRFIERNLTETQYTGEWADEAQYAATLYMASLVVPTLRIVESERLPAGSINYAKVDLTAIAANLLARANGRIGDIVGATETDTANKPSASAIFVIAKRKDLPRF